MAAEGRSWRWRSLPWALVVLSAVPVFAGSARLVGVAQGGPVTPDNARFLAAPVPVVLHVLGSSVFCVLGAFQFTTGFLRRRMAWHRAAGRVLAACGALSAATGLWMTVTYPHVPGDTQGLYVMRLVFGGAMLFSVVRGVAAVLRGQVNGHAAWMMRGYAIGMGAGTQVLVHLPAALLGLTVGPNLRTVLMGLRWVLNVAVVETVLHRRRNAAGGTGGAPAFPTA